MKRADFLWGYRNSLRLISASTAWCVFLTAGVVPVYALAPKPQIKKVLQDVAIRSVLAVLSARVQDRPTSKGWVLSPHDRFKIESILAKSIVPLQMDFDSVEFFHDERAGGITIFAMLKVKGKPTELMATVLSERKSLKPPGHGPLSYSLIPIPTEAVEGKHLRVPMEPIQYEGISSYLDLCKHGEYWLKVPHFDMVGALHDRVYLTPFKSTVEILETVLAGYLLAKRRMGGISDGMTIVHRLVLPKKAVQNIPPKLLSNMHVYRRGDKVFFPFAIYQKSPPDVVPLFEALTDLCRDTQIRNLDLMALDEGQRQVLVQSGYCLGNQSRAIKEGRTDLLHSEFWNEFDPNYVNLLLLLLVEEFAKDDAIAGKLKEMRKEIPGGRATAVRIRKAITTLRGDGKFLETVQTLWPGEFAKAKTAAARIHRILQSYWNVQINLINEGVLNVKRTISEHWLLTEHDMVVLFDYEMLQSFLKEGDSGLYPKTLKGLLDGWQMETALCLEWANKNSKDGKDETMWLASHLEGSWVTADVMAYIWQHRNRRNFSPLPEASGLIMPSPGKPIFNSSKQINTGALHLPEMAL